jgi:hypothetical protein
LALYEKKKEKNQGTEQKKTTIPNPRNKMYFFFSTMRRGAGLKGSHDEIDN